MTFKIELLLQAKKVSNKSHPKEVSIVMILTLINLKDMLQIKMAIQNKRRKVGTLMNLLNLCCNY
ncbi:hypothetical protein TYRP_020252 [Tyrophagus putrescentiae]|nr:hypothetical protein TYRP_020252 [Tyrophagus putrescentiae]